MTLIQVLTPEYDYMSWRQSPPPRPGQQRLSYLPSPAGLRLPARPSFALSWAEAGGGWGEEAYLFWTPPGGQAVGAFRLRTSGAQRRGGDLFLHSTAESPLEVSLWSLLHTPPKRDAGGLAPISQKRKTDVETARG